MALVISKIFLWVWIVDYCLQKLLFGNFFGGWAAHVVHKHFGPNVRMSRQQAHQMSERLCRTIQHGCDVDRHTTHNTQRYRLGTVALLELFYCNFEYTSFRRFSATVTYGVTDEWSGGARGGGYCQGTAVQRYMYRIKTGIQ